VVAIALAAAVAVAANDLGIRKLDSVKQYSGISRNKYKSKTQKFIR
jgi:hypothetical protein